jgi:co-chaperonin GroES (HSP10)
VGFFLCLHGGVVIMNAYIYHMKKAGVNHIILQIDDVFTENSIVGELNLYQDTSFHPEQHIKGVGKCLAIPDSEGQGDPHENIVQEVQVGDEILFHYNVINEGNYMDEGVYRCEYQHVFAVRDGDAWKMIGGWVMMKPVYEDGVEKVDIDGRSMAVRQTESGIITETHIIPSTEFAELMHVGTPMKNRSDCPYKSGDQVLYLKDMDFEVEVDGERIYMMRQEELLGKVG